VLTFGAVKTLVGAHTSANGERRAAVGVLGWPAGRELVGLAAGVLLVSAVVIVYWALSRRFKESLATDEMREGTERLVTGLGVLGLFALAVVLGVVGWFLLKAAIAFDPNAPVGIGGALSKLAHATYGPWLLGVTAAGLIVFAVFDLFQARYHRA
jgi:sterol desaturase/sphingolipid hydroxylase (fatty acid hydroxylase superfamily)